MGNRMISGDSSYAREHNVWYLNVTNLEEILRQVDEKGHEISVDNGVLDGLLRIRPKDFGEEAVSYSAAYNEDYFEWENYKLFFRSLRLENPKGVVFLHHGFSNSSIGIGEYAQFLREMGLDVYAMDSIGHGRSSGGRGILPQWEKLIESYDHFLHMILKETKYQQLPKFVMGESMGGAISLQIAYRNMDVFKTGGAIFLSPAFQIPKLPPVFVQKLLHVFARCWPTLPVAPQREDNFTRDPEMQRRIVEQPLRIVGSIRASSGVAVVDMAEDCRKKFKDFNVPFVILHSKGDLSTQFEGSKLLYEQSPVKEEKKKFVGFEEAYHVLLKETKETASVAWKAVHDFIQEQLKDGMDETFQVYMEE